MCVKPELSAVYSICEIEFSYCASVRYSDVQLYSILVGFNCNVLSHFGVSIRFVLFGFVVVYVHLFKAVVGHLWTVHCMLAHVHVRWMTWHGYLTSKSVGIWWVPSIRKIILIIGVALLLFMLCGGAVSPTTDKYVSIAGIVLVSLFFQLHGSAEVRFSEALSSNRNERLMTDQDIARRTETQPKYPYNRVYRSVFNDAKRSLESHFTECECARPMSGIRSWGHRLCVL